MRDYAKGSPRFWTGELAAALRGNPEAQALAWYLITAPHSNMIGLYHLPLAYAADDLGWGIDGVSEALRCLVEAGFCQYDDRLRVVWVIEAARHECGESLKPTDTKIVAVRKILQEHRKSAVFQGFCARYGVGYGAAIDGVSDTPSGGYQGRIRYQKQNQKQKQKQKPDAPDGADQGGNGKPKKARGGKLPDIPASLQASEPWRRAWSDWISHRRHKNASLTPEAARRQLAKMEKLGPAKAVAALEHSMEKGWTGLFDPPAPAHVRAQPEPWKEDTHYRDLTGKDL